MIRFCLGLIIAMGAVEAPHDAPLSLIIAAGAVPDALAIIMPWRQGDAALPSWATLTETGAAR